MPGDIKKKLIQEGVKMGTKAVADRWIEGHARGEIRKELDKMPGGSNLGEKLPEAQLEVTYSSEETAAAVRRGAKLIGKGTHCIPCSLNHLSTCSGLLSEALRFARSDGLGSEEVISRVGLCQDEINAMERVDLRAEVVARLEPGEKEIAHDALVGVRELRHKIEHMGSTEELENATAQAQELRTDVGKRWLRGRIQGG